MKRQNEDREEQTSLYQKLQIKLGFVESIHNYSAKQ